VFSREIEAFDRYFTIFYAIVLLLQLYLHFMKHQRIQNHLSRSAHLQMSQIQTYLQIFHIVGIFLKSIKFPMTNKSPQGSFNTRIKINPDRHRQHMLYNFGQHENGNR